MIINGLSPGMALDSLARQQDDLRFAAVLEDITHRVHSGSTLSSAFARYPDHFPASTLAVIRTGEEGGDIGGRLRRAAQLMQNQIDFRHKIKHALTSPLLTAAICGLVLLLVVKLVFPKFVALYEQMDLTFPAISRIVFLIVGALDHPVTLGLALAFTVGAVMYRDELRQRAFDALLWCPWSRPVVGKLLCASLCETLAYLYKDGIPVHRSLQMIINATPFESHKASLREARDALTMSGSLSKALESVDYFPPIFHSMLVVGEESGSMEQMLEANKRLMDEEIDSLIGAVTSLLEPLVICVMGICMAVLFVGMFLPIYGVLAKLGGG